MYNEVQNKLSYTQQDEEYLKIMHKMTIIRSMSSIILTRFDSK